MSRDSLFVLDRYRKKIVQSYEWRLLHSENNKTSSREKEHYLFFSVLNQGMLISYISKASKSRKHVLEISDPYLRCMSSKLGNNLSSPLLNLLRIELRLSHPVNGDIY